MLGDNKNCRDCVYFGGNNAYVRCCTYILVVGRMRPCDPGDGCTVKKKRHRRRMFAKDGKKEK